MEREVVAVKIALHDGHGWRAKASQTVAYVRRGRPSCTGRVASLLAASAVIPPLQQAARRTAQYIAALSTTSSCIHGVSVNRN